MGEITRQLPTGWSLSSRGQSGRIWGIYQKAKVSPAQFSGRLQVFIEIPLVYQGNQFQLFRLVTLPIHFPPKPEGSLFENLPSKLAVTPDLQSFIELSDVDAGAWYANMSPLCKTHTGVMKRNRVSCTFALFQNNSRAIQEICVRRIVPWPGAVVQLQEIEHG